MNDYCLQPHVPKGKKAKDVLIAGYSAVEIVNIPPLIRFFSLKPDEVMVVLLEGFTNAKNSLRIVRVITNHKLALQIHANKNASKTWFIMPRKVVLAMNPEVEEVLP